ncbi:MAG: leucine-rich repeat domain-containing protein, partial [Bacteriovorax sp.]|nr:leucine-rich repeat domain-containing protein [Bacteriovorax sp.]
SLLYLNLKNNRISSLPDLVSKTTIQTFIVGHNYLRDVQKILPFLEEVKTLDLSHNQLREITDHFFLLKNLQRLNLDSNKLRTVPYFLQEMKGLTHLSLEKNSFSHEEKTRIEKEFGINLQSDQSE